MKRRFEMTEGSTAKFWEIDGDGASFTVRFGRIGTEGQTQTKTFGDAGQAKKAADKLVAEKTGKGYVEVAAETEPAAPKEEKAKKPAAPKEDKAAAPKEEKPKKAAAPKEEKPKKAAKVAAPTYTTYAGKVIGERALANAAERLSAATNADLWRTAAEKAGVPSFEFPRAVAHMLVHGLFTPTCRIHVVGSRKALLQAEPGAALAVLSKLTEPLVETVRTEQPVVRNYLSVLARLQRLAPDALRAATLPPTFHRAAQLVRALAGEALDAAEGAAAVSAVVELLPYGDTAIEVVDDKDEPKPVAPEVLGAALARIGGPHWIRTFPLPDRLPAAVAAPALADEPLEQVGRALSLFNKQILDARTEPPARFFEVAAALEDQPASYMRAAGIAHARTPDEIPAGGEDFLEPHDVAFDEGFFKLGTARLDAWAERWIERFPAALTTEEPSDPAFNVGAGLLNLAMLGAPFSAPLQERIIGVPRPYAWAKDQYDVRGFFQRRSSFSFAAAERMLPVLARLARKHEGAAAQGLRLSLCAAVRNLREGTEVPEDIDELLSLGDANDYDAGRAVREALEMLPVARAERVVARTAHGLANPFEELTYAREGASEQAMSRYARLVAAGRETDAMWHNVDREQLAVLGPAFGPILAKALAGETLSQSFFDRLARVIHPDAFATLKKAVGENVLDLAREMKKLAQELGGERVVVYAMSTGREADGIARVGGRPAGIAEERVPRHRGRKLVHAFTVDLRAVPELAARYPNARALSLWVQGYSEDSARAQAIVSLTEDEVRAAPGKGGVALELLRLEVPAEIFAAEPSERAAYARQLLYGKAGFLLGGPLWLQTGKHGLDPSFVAQYDERLASGANFGDMGICYSFADRAEWQCH